MQRIQLVPYTRLYLDRSWDWLQDPEVKELTMTPPFSRADQQRFFAGLSERDDYLIWGVELNDGLPIGAAGLKNIRNRTAEYWGYIGDRIHWGRGLGGEMLELVEQKAAELGVTELYLKVWRRNERAIALYRKAGFAERDDDEEVVMMTKSLVH